MRIHDKTINDEVIEITDKAAFNSIGKDVILNNCTVIIKVPSKSLSIQGKISNSTIIAKSKLVGFSWLDVSLKDCVFQGTFKENEFGSLDENNPISSIGCDFSKATLEDCLFYGEMSKSHIFPKWPNFIIRDPHKNKPLMNGNIPNDNILDIIESIDYFKEELSVIAMNSDALAKELNEKPEVIKNFFSEFSFVSL